ncbi:rab proteins geranylgeranyltransferase component A 2-like [Saccostrea echinata]|uniref:rab proteins geranylgeranyltransferase component A 2-like n=1 Tax=Saccostrea echinata TaxID=191078 RepID=UPI002A80C5B2|nr:rab proteins geranylgeranyltransferase component A 2-like [Saccostrea echinata]
MAEDLPDEFDVVVIGTGMPESILAAAYARIGQSVLHIDRNPYYSGQWASFSLKSIEEWVQTAQTPEDGSGISEVKVEGQLINLHLTDKSYSKHKLQFHISDPKQETEVKKEPNEEAADKFQKEVTHSDNQDNTVYRDQDNSSQVKIPDSDPGKSNVATAIANTEPCDSENVGASAITESTEDQGGCKETINQGNIPEEGKDLLQTSHGTEEKQDSQIPEGETSKELASTTNTESEKQDSQILEGETSKESASNTETEKLDSQILKGETSKEPASNTESENNNLTSVSNEQAMLWTESRLRKEWRKFNLDLSPKLLYCGGSMVELLITSDIAKYCEFKTVSRILTLIDGNLRKVPCSRADVFSSKDVSMIEKRMMMKFLTFCVDYEKHQDDYTDFIEKPYKEYLEHQKLSKNVIHFIQHAISMTSNSTLTPEGLKRTQKFLHSLGRYGNTAFLWPMYGSGEMPQSFCRMCAVFGGVYCLRTPAASLVINSDNICTGVVMTTGKHIRCKRLVMENSYAPDSFIDSVSNRFVNRGILVTDKSMMPSDDLHQLSLLRIPDEADEEHPTTILELPASAMACPDSLYVVHLTKESEDDNKAPEESLQADVTKLFQEDSSGDEKPQIIWSLYYQQKINTGGQCSNIPSNVTLVPGPGPEIDIDQAVTIARGIFEEAMPGEDFLPRPPNPEDIIFVDEEETHVTQESDKTEFNTTSQNSDNNETETDSTEGSPGEKPSKSDTVGSGSEGGPRQTDSVGSGSEGGPKQTHSNDTENKTEETSQKDCTTEDKMEPVNP